MIVMCEIDEREMIMRDVAFNAFNDARDTNNEYDFETQFVVSLIRMHAFNDVTIYDRCMSLIALIACDVVSIQNVECDDDICNFICNIVDNDEIIACVSCDINDLFDL